MHRLRGWLSHDQLDGPVLHDGRRGKIDEDGIVLLWIVENFTSAQIAGRTCDAERNPKACLQDIDAGDQPRHEFKPGRK